MKRKTDSQISRRNMLKKGAIAVGSGAATTLLGVGALRTADAAGPARQAVAAPVILQGAQAGRRFRAALGGARNTTIEELQLLPIGDRHVLVRTDTSAPCYTLVIGGIGGTPSVVPPAPNAGGPVAGAPAAPGAAVGGPPAAAPRAGGAGEALAVTGHRASRTIPLRGSWKPSARRLNACNQATA